MHELWRAAAIAVAVLAAGVTDVAVAGTATGRPAQFTAAGGERNVLTVGEGSGGAVQFSDEGAPVSAGLWCVPFPFGQAACDPDADPRDTDGGGVNVDLGDGDDRAVVRFVPGTGAFAGTVRITAGAGSDQLENVAGRGSVRFDGGDGDDTLVTGAGAGAVLLGGAGADLMRSGAGRGFVASYEDHGRGGVRVTLDGLANDGAAGERDDVRTADVTGSPGPDVLSGDGAANALTGSGGADVLDGGGGDDALDATLGYGLGAAGPDGPDTVRCGPGEDDARADADDRAGVDCETIRVGGSGGPELTLDVGSARAGRTGSVRLTYRLRYPDPAVAVMSRSTVRFVDRNGRSASSSAQFVLGGAAQSAVLRVRLNRSARRRLARSRSATLALFAQRVSRETGQGATGYARFNTAVTIRRSAAR